MKIDKVAMIGAGSWGTALALVLARDLYPEKLPGDEPEEMEVVPWKLAELDQLMLREDFSEGRSLAALFIAREWLGKMR